MNEYAKKNTTWITIFTILVLLIIAVAVFQFVQARTYKQNLQNQYSRAFNELSDSVSNIQVSLEKGMLITSPKQMVSLSNEINRKTESAKSALGQLPIQNTSLDQTSRFLSQVGDYTYSLSLRMLDNEKITADEYTTLKNLTGYARTLGDSIYKMQSQLLSGNLSIGRMEVSAQSNNNVSLDIGLGELEKQFAEYPALVYDGPFSSSIELKEPVMLKGKKEVSLEDAKKKAKDFLGNSVQVLEASGESDGNLPTYSFIGYPDPKNKNVNISIDITKAGGEVAWVLNNRSINEKKLSIDDAKKKASEYLTSKGYMNMEDSYYDVSGNVATLNYAYVQNGVMVYPDLIKVKIALDTGESLGIEARGYLLNHKTTRDIHAPTISKEQAKSKINSLLNIDNITLAIIPTESMNELYCYELKGTSEGRHFLVYINAMTGVEEKVLMLIESEEGVLSM